MSDRKSLLVNVAIFPKIMTIAIGKPIQEDIIDEGDDKLKRITDPEIVADIPRSANVLYLQRILSKHDSIECKLLEQYAYGVVFSDEDYRKLIELVFTSANQPVEQNINSTQKELLGLYGLAIERDENGKGHLTLLEDQIPKIKAETWDCITVDTAHDVSGFWVDHQLIMIAWVFQIAIACKTANKVTVFSLNRKL